LKPAHLILLSAAYIRNTKETDAIQRVDICVIGNHSQNVALINNKP